MDFIYYLCQILILILASGGQSSFVSADSELTSLDTHLQEEHGVRYPNRCETCKILATELEERLRETGKTHEVIEIG